MIKKEIRFLQTISAWGYEVLVPINRIKFIYITNKEIWELHIISEGKIDDHDSCDSEWVECFSNTDEGMAKLDKRFNMIKEILNGG